MEIAPDAVAFVQERCDVLCVAGRGQFEGQGGLGSEGLGKRELRAVELGGTNLA